MFNETNIFELLNDKYVLPKKVKLFESFSGIGCQRLAFNRLGIEVEMIGISEIDKYAIQSYNAIHGDTKNWGSICDIKGQYLPQIDVFTYSFPCTDLSKAGKQAGLNSTRSGLVYEVLRILQELKLVDRLPKCLIMENVVDLVQVKFIRQFQDIQLELEGLGYKNYAQTLNAKNYGVAQNRDRIFMVSVLGDKYYEFPKPIKLEKRLKDYLENYVDEKYYLSDTMVDYFEKHTKEMEEKGNGFRFNKSDGNKIANAITTRAGARMDDNFIQIPESYYFTKEQLLKSGYLGNAVNPNLKDRIDRNKMIINKEVAYTINCHNNDRRIGDSNFVTDDFEEIVVKDFVEQYLMIPEDTKQGYSKAYEGDVVYINRPEQKRGVVQSQMIQTLKTGCADVGVIENMRIRKLTPKECMRLMGINDDEFDKASKVVSNSQLYKQAGNGIVVDVFAYILSTMKGE